MQCTPLHETHEFVTTQCAGLVGSANA